MPQVAPGEPKRLRARIACKRALSFRDEARGSISFVAPPTAASHNKEVCRGLPADAVARREAASRQTLPPRRNSSICARERRCHDALSSSAKSFSSGAVVSSKAANGALGASSARVIITISLRETGEASLPAITSEETNIRPPPRPTATPTGRILLTQERN